MNSLLAKEKAAIKFIRNAEQLALKMDDRGFHVAFSGGKDSQVLYHLMQESGCKFHAEMQVTSVDPPQLMKFVRSNYSEVNLNLPKTNMLNLILKYKILPTRQARFCCTELKEQSGSGTCTCVGIRAAESIRRSKRNNIELISSRTRGKGYSINGDQLIEKQNFDLFDMNTDKVVTCVSGKDKVLISPIFNWSNNDVWNYIRGNKIDYCELYDIGFHRIGCMFCPMASVREKQLELKLFPTIAEKVYLRAIRELQDMGKYDNFSSPEEVFEWYISNDSVNNFKSKKPNNKQPTLSFDGYKNKNL